MNQETELKHLVDLLDAIIEIHDPKENLTRTDVSAKIDFLDRAIQAWRFHSRHDENDLPFETFVQSSMFVDNGRVSFRVPEKIRQLDSGTPPVRLQPRLLMFLLLYHREKYAIYDIIEKFIDKIRDELTILDFKRTQTGVIRCFTNTRFAAHTLRDYGFFRYTHKEAFKTWVLSLPGLLVASKVIERSNSWSIDDNNALQNRDVHPEILSADLALRTYDEFVRQLRSICKPNVEVFDTFGKVLRRSHELLEGYWEVLSDGGIKQADRKAETAKRIKTLEELPNMEDFYAEFSKCVNVEQLLKDVDEEPQGMEP